MTDLGSNERELDAALHDAQVPERDRAGVALARRYAQLLDAVLGAVDETQVYNDLGPKYLAALNALGLTLAGRGAKGGTQDGAVGGKLDELRARRAKRAAG